MLSGFSMISNVCSQAFICDGECTSSRRVRIISSLILLYVHMCSHACTPVHCYTESPLSYTLWARQLCSRRLKYWKCVSTCSNVMQRISFEPPACLRASMSIHSRTCMNWKYRRNIHHPLLQVRAVEERGHRRQVQRATAWIGHQIRLRSHRCNYAIMHLYIYSPLHCYIRSCIDPHSSPTA